MFVLQNSNADPFTGSFTFKGQINDPSNKWAIDGTVFEHPSGQLYFIWSGWEGDVSGPQLLYIAEMSDPWTISSDRVLISTPTLDWETRGGSINEGPEVTIRNGVISLVYSASGSWTNDYCLGLLTASTNSDPMNPASWKKHAKPIFQSGVNVLAPGHHSFTKSPDDQEDWIIYHSARYNNSGWSRLIRAQKFTWNANSTPNLGKPANANIPIGIPSGDQVRIRYQAEKASLLNGPTAISDDTASNKVKVGNIQNSNSTVNFTIQCAIAGTYAIAIRDASAPAGGATSSLLLSINNGNAFSVYVVCNGWSMWGANVIHANLNQGINTLTFTKGTNIVELDVIDVFLDA